MEFVSFAPDNWHGPRHNRHYFCLELAKHHKVLFVSPPIYVEKLLQARSRRQLPESGVRQVADNLWTYVPPKTLFTNFRFPRLDRLFRRLRLQLLRRVMTGLGFKRPVLLIWHPQYLEMLDAFAGSPAIYYIYDHLSGYTGNDSGQRSEQELELIRRADLVFVLSRKLLEENSPYNPNMVLLPNAVDFEHFSKARDPLTVIPDDLAAIPIPRIGYIGSINEKVDIALLDQIAAARSDWSIVMIGRKNFASHDCASRFEDLVRRPNVFWIPYRHPDQLPSYLKGLDVCLMCYVINGWTYFGDPSKMHEYLAAGKPTIGTALPSIVEHQNVVTVSDGQDQWIAAISHALSETGEDARMRRIEVARANSYAERIRTASRLIGEQFGERLRA